MPSIAAVGSSTPVAITPPTRGPSAKEQQITTQPPEAAMEMRHATMRDGIFLPYEVLGSGETAVFLHGGFAGRDSFARQKPLAAST